MTAPALVHTYRYAAPSALDRDGTRAHLTLAASLDPENATPPFFFRGGLVAPRRTADAMLAVARVARTRFYVPPAMLTKILAAADPVVTCTPDAVRFEAFSACAGVYTRFDLSSAGVAIEHVSRGTTNVDFNPEMRALLAKTRATEDVRLSVGADRVEVASERGTAIERKVPLPLRWIRSFGDVQAVLAGMTARLRVDGVEARRFLKELPKTAARASWIVRSGRGLRISQVSAADGVLAGGLHRLAMLVDVAADATELVAHGDATGASAWELVFPEGRLVFALSPEASRGFSGEGRLLRDLALPDAPLVATLRARLHWNAGIEPRAFGADTGATEAEVKSALASLASHGLVGYDLAAQSYFHRELPFASAASVDLHPRLAGARRLLEAGSVGAIEERDGIWSAHVAASGGGVYDVRVDMEGFRCTCAWYGKHGESRGPCKHALALQMHAGKDDR